MDYDNHDVGRDIKDAVWSAVSSGDFSGLNARITDSVTEAVSSVRERARENGRKNAEAGAEAAAEYRRRYRSARTREARPAPPQERFAKRPKGSVSGYLWTVSGAGIGGLGLFFLTAFLFGGANFFVSLPVLACSAGALFYGKGLLARVRRFRRYQALIGEQSYVSLETLSEGTQKSETFVRKDVEKMLLLGMFPHGYVDDERKTLLLTDAMYLEYRRLQKERRQVQGASQVHPVQQEPETEAQRLYRETEERGRRDLEAIRRANDAIPGEVVSEKLDRLEHIVRSIFAQVREHPEQLPELRRFLDYYMPTTLKLVETYEQLDRQDYQGANIRSAKDEIEKTLDTINSAFEKLFDSLFAETSSDISSDIAVLNAMLRQEGLAGKDFQ